MDLGRVLDDDDAIARPECRAASAFSSVVLPVPGSARDQDVLLGRNGVVKRAAGRGERPDADQIFEA